jgi:hypothetical protein
MTHSPDRPVVEAPSGNAQAAGASGRSQPQRSFLRRFSLHWLPALIVAANTSYAGLFTYQGLVGTSHLQKCV